MEVKRIAGRKERVDWQDFRQVRDLLKKEEELAKQQLRKRALDKARKVAVLLKSQYGVEKVYLYGSLAWGKFGKGSDIDLLIVGFRGSNHFWRMQVEAEEIASPFPVSIVCFEDALPPLRNRVLQEGVEL
ncbi:MAG: nucleotidyltransferase domain-containing protein [Bacillota bacterium]|nr:nucleotidyltransferase domain-containing protein [Bacillota bacterium]